MMHCIIAPRVRILPAAGPELLRRNIEHASLDSRNTMK